jgi:hypothetical protein
MSDNDAYECIQFIKAKCGYDDAFVEQMTLEWRAYRNGESGTFKYNRALTDDILRRHSRDESRKRGIATIKRLFQKHIPDRVMSESAIVDRSRINDENPVYRYHYDHDGISITYLNRLTRKLGDLDRFTDYTIHVNGKVVAEVVDN